MSREQSSNMGDQTGLGATGGGEELLASGGVEAAEPDASAQRYGAEEGTPPLAEESADEGGVAAASGQEGNSGGTAGVAGAGQEEEDEPWPPRQMGNMEALGVALVLLLIGGGALAYHLPPADPELEMHYWRPDGRTVELLEMQSKQRLAAVQVADEEVLELMEAFAEMQGAYVANLGVQETRAKEMVFANAVRAHVERRGPDSYIAVGEMMLLSFLKHLRSLQELWAVYDGTLADWMRENPDNPHVGALRRVSGVMLERVAAAGLVGPGVAMDGDRLRVAGALWRGFWLEGLGLGASQKLLSMEEQLLIARYKVEVAPELTDKRKVELLSAPDVGDGYPHALVKGILLARVGDIDESLSAFGEAWVQRVRPWEARAWWVALYVRTGEFFKLTRAE